MLIAAAVAVLTLIGGLIVLGTNADEDQITATVPSPRCRHQPQSWG
jgi:hypothetical protein